MSSLKFGTSGLRGLVEDLTDGSSFAYTRAFLRHDLRTRVGSGPDTASPDRSPATLLVGRDLRASSPAIAGDCIAAAMAEGWQVLDCGELPTPALALLSLSKALPAIMVTGSHIPDDRNGLKFYTARGEITKGDEAGILACIEGLTPLDMRHAPSVPAGAGNTAALDAYRSRYIDAFGPKYLEGMTIGVYQQSTVARDLLVEVVEALGGTALPFARASRFIPVDTEAYRAEDIALLMQWAAENPVDAIVSADGDADRPLIADAQGRIVRGDVLGLLTAKGLGLTRIVTPLTSSSAIERVVAPATVTRTRVGSPFVIAAMQAAEREGATGIVGFEANGGLLLGSAVDISGRRLAALPTRDALLPILASLGAIARHGLPLSRVVEALGAGFAAGNRLERVPPSASGPLLARLADDSGFRAQMLASAGFGVARDVNGLDGVRITLEDGRIVHYRASGNAPELRCYVEAGSQEEANALLSAGLEAAAGAMRSIAMPGD